MNISKKRLAIIVVLFSILSSTIIGGVMYTYGAGSISEAVFEAGTQVETASYVVWREGITYYAKNGSTGVIEFSGTNASQIINNAFSSDAYAIIYLKNGVYSLDVSLTPSPYNSLYGESFGAREQMATLEPSANFPADDYLIKIEDPDNAWGCGGLESLYLYNPLFASKVVNGILLDAQNVGVDTDALKNYDVTNIRFTYVSVALHCIGFVWESRFDNLQVLGFNEGFSGEKAIWLERGIGGGSASEGVALNVFSNILIRDDGGFEVAVYLGNDTKYNKFSKVDCIKGNYSEAMLEFENAFSNLVSLLRNSDNAGVGDGVLFNGTRCFANSIFASQLVPCGGTTHNVINYINWAYNNYVEFNALGAWEFGSPYKVAGAGAGYNTVIDLLPFHTDLAHADYTNPITYTGVSNVTVRFWNGTIWNP